MKKWPVSIAFPIAVVVCAVVVLIFTLGGKAETVAVLDYKKIISESIAVKKAGDYFSELQETYKSEIDTVKDPKEQVVVLEKKQAEFAKKIEALDSYLNATLEDIIEKYREKNAIAIIFPKETALSFNQALDITSTIITEFNAIPLDKEKIQQIIDDADKQDEQNSAEASTPSETETK